MKSVHKQVANKCQNEVYLQANRQINDVPWEQVRREIWHVTYDQIAPQVRLHIVGAVLDEIC